MRISINLATRPFVELRPLFARLRIAMIVLALLATGLLLYLRVLDARAAVATEDMRRLKSQTSAYEQERSTNESRMRQPQNQSVLARSQFLNSLFASKSFSWTAVMMDLELVLPSGVQVTSIDPVVSKTGELSIRLRVTGDRDKAIQLVRNLETSQRFVAPKIGGETALTAEKANALGRGATGGFQNASAQGSALAPGNGVEFEIFSGYNPLPANAAKSPQPHRSVAQSTKPAAPVKPAAAGKPKVITAPNARPVPGGLR